ncbi:hypothetical protein CI109_107241 [Kwoniella shandongensis]|uniref:Methyltransferase type 11 domain-containing protein n=1 Tax=Kwoniella shandongensis TaxID=1734106 RepID=A0AAJ8N0P3_9TREE
MSNVHNVAVTGFGEGTNDIYDQYRPTYPPDALHKIHQVLSASSPLSSSSNVYEEPKPKTGWKIIEPGSGTGIFSRLLISPPTTPKRDYPKFDISTLVGVEPSSGMRNAFKRGFEKIITPAEGNKSTTTKTASASASEGEGGSQSGSTAIKFEIEGSGTTVGAVEGGFDDLSNVEQFGITKEEGVNGVIIAQAWHWCPDHDKALREIASYLPPSHPLILIWNLESFTPNWQASLRKTYQPYDLDTPQYYKNLWRKMFDTKFYEELFETQEEWKTEWKVGITEDQLIRRLFSKSYLTPAHLSEENRIKLDAELRKIIRGADHDWIDEEKGIFKYAYETDIIVCRRNAA